MSNITSNSSLQYQELPAPQVKGMLAGSPSESAYISGKQNAELLSSLSKVGGRKRTTRRIKYTHRGGAGSIVVPVMPVPYNDQMAGSQSVIGQTVGNASTLLQANENSKYDSVKLAPPTSGFSTGQVPHNKTGGRRKKTRRMRKSRKSRKSRKCKK
jgi:hypothetical protein